MRPNSIGWNSYPEGEMAVPGLRMGSGAVVSVTLIGQRVIGEYREYDLEDVVGLTLRRKYIINVVNSQ
jgi:hypothetical protein